MDGYFGAELYIHRLDKDFMTDPEKNMSAAFGLPIIINKKPRLLSDKDRIGFGGVAVETIHTPGHTPACVSYRIGDAVFTGDTLFMPDYGTARCDFPGGDARTLYRSIHRLTSLPDEARVFLCHDYKAPPGRTEFAWETTIGAQRTGNIHIRDDVSEDEFVAMRTQRDATLPMPKLILPSVQVNMNGGRPPEPDGGFSWERTVLVEELRTAFGAR